MKQMVLKKLWTVCCVLFVLTAGAQHVTRMDFDQGWKFKLDSVNTYEQENVDDASWRRLNLPHDWSIEGSFSNEHPATPGGGALPGGIGWYRKTFTLPQTTKDKLVFIQFDGVYRNSQVWINGHLLGRRPYGYISFQYELSSFLKYGGEKNVIAVKVDNQQQPNSRWYSGSGIYRNVWLTTTSKLHVDNWGTYITTPAVSNETATIRIETNVINESPAKQNFVLTTIIYDAQGKQVAKSSSPSLSVGALKNISQAFRLARPHLWSIEDPYLYYAVSQVSSNGKITDEYRTNFGVRSFNFDREKGFFLNGKSVKILGVCNHHDLGALGAAINKRALQRQLEILKAMGCNGIRTSHNPPAPELLDLCDQMGFIVMDEAFDMWARSKTKFDYSLDFNQWHRKDLQDMILRDRNHPSVIIWSVGNEIGEQWGEDTSGRVIARELVHIVQSLDTTRPVTTANNEINKWNNLIQSGAFELVGYNYNHNRWEKFLEDWPGKKLIVTESTSALETRGHYDLVPVDTIRRWPKAWDKPFNEGNPDFTVSAYDHVSAPWGSTHEESIKALKKSDHVSGMYIWTGFDYLGEPTPYSWPARSSYFGIIDLAGFPKDVYFLYQSEFTETPVLHILPHWNWKRGDVVDVVVYYNRADQVELFLNEKSLGVKSKQGDALHVSWRVPFTAGTLKAVSKKNGQVVLTTEVKTAGAPAKIILKADRKTIQADGKDLSFVTATIVDQNGITVPDATNLVQFSITDEGLIAGVDNGSPVSHEPFKSNQHKAMAGLVLAIVQSNAKKGRISLKATAQGLKGDEITIVAE